MYPDISENTSFLSILHLHSQRDGIFSQQKRSFLKTLSRLDPLENVVFMLCGWVKRELLENADITASIYATSELALGSLDHLRTVCLSILLLKFKYQILNLAASSYGGYFQKYSSCGYGCFLYR